MNDNRDPTTRASNPTGPIPRVDVGGASPSDRTPDWGVDFMGLASTPMPEADPLFERRVQVIVRELQGLDRRGVHEVLQRAGSIARGRIG